MATQQEFSAISTSLFAALPQIRYLNTLEQLQLSGKLLFTEPKGKEWIFYLDKGKIIYATGGINPVRRWQRNLAVHCPNIVAKSWEIKRDLGSIDKTTPWDCQLLSLWIKQEKITPKEAANTIYGMILEVLFDLGQTGDVTHQFKAGSLSNQFIPIDLRNAIADVEQLWKAWHNASLGNYSPNQAPIIKQPNQLKQQTSPEVYETLTKFLDGKQSLRDLAVQRKWDVVEIGRSLLAYLELGWVQLREIPDLPTPISPTTPETPGAIAPSTLAKPIANSTKPLVACVDDSQWINQMMERLITIAGYRFLAVDNPLRAIPLLLARKPDLIFLDLMMPNVNGYEVCTQLRKLSSFRTTPIVILTGNNGATERIRSKLAGASDFLSKPLDAVSLLKILRKHLEQGAINY